MTTTRLAEEIRKLEQQYYKASSEEEEAERARKESEAAKKKAEEAQKLALEKDWATKPEKPYLLAGTTRAMDQKALDDEEKSLWDRDFQVLVEEAELTYQPLGWDLKSEESFYLGACEVAKFYLNKPFGGLKPDTGQFGMRFLIPQDWRTAAGGGTGNQFYSWRQTKSTGAATTCFDLWGSSASPILAENTSERKGIIAFHKVLSYDPNPRVIMMQWTVNAYPYSPYAVELFSKIGPIPGGLKVLPVPGRVLLQPGAKLYLKVWIDKRHGGTAIPSTATTIDIELVPFGLIFAEQGYLNLDTNIV